MSKQVILFLFTVLLFGLFASAAPTPVEKRVLKQLKLKRGDPEPFVRRDEAPKPSGYVAKRDEASRVIKRDEPSAPKPSKSDQIVPLSMSTMVQEVNSFDVLLSVRSIYMAKSPLLFPSQTIV
ncbi:hypothetical protein J3R30DRAFT_3405971 [Lentinula aciculospora]|uniref:Uncharacterized protein n=1 Tax=Lentinula aciculospora TaxID=153920 RepID=A0A9W9A6M5_9AGAR|nr:hypothetical protein J3R30DRAFT_3405971 [Lentinula aciculospora]